MIALRSYGFLASATRLIEAHHRLGESLAMLPLLDGDAAESPGAADPEAGNEPASQQAVDGGGVNSQVFGKFGDGKNLFVRGHNSSFIPPGQKLMWCVSCVSLIPWFSLPAPMSSNRYELFSSPLARFTPRHAFELS